MKKKTQSIVPKKQKRRMTADEVERYRLKLIKDVEDHPELSKIVQIYGYHYVTCHKCTGEKANVHYKKVKRHITSQHPEIADSYQDLYPHSLLVATQFSAKQSRTARKTGFIKRKRR
jgi:hypothetical protein